MEEPETLNLLTTLIPFAIIVFVIAIGVVLLNQQFRKNLYEQQLEKETLKAKYQEKLLHTAVQVQEDERKRIARDLHDELGAVLSIGRMQLVQLEQRETFDPKKIRETRHLIENALASTRRISHELMPLNLENLGLEKALKSLLNRIEEAGVISTNVNIAESVNQLPWLLQLGLYRIYSELVNNTLKYAESSHLSIRITKETGHLFCYYDDNGKGLNADLKTTGIGFKSIESRVNTLKGTWEYGNRKEGGFYAEIKFPVHTYKIT
jgi:signal transduction histidine kinase